MSEQKNGIKWDRALVVTPAPNDGTLICDVLRKSGIEASYSPGFSDLIVDHDCCAVLVLAEEALGVESTAKLVDFLRVQPLWSDLPIIVLAAESEVGMQKKESVENIYNIGNATILQRPVPMMSLVSTVRAALRARGRQIEVRELLQQREREVKERDEFLAMLAHELRNPLAPIRNGLHIWKLDNSSPEQKIKARDSMERQVHHVTRMLDDLLDVARVSKGKVTLRRERLDLVALVKSCAEDHRPIIEAATLSFEVKLPSHPVWATIDKTRITQVIGNLLVNALKFTERNGRVTLAMQAQPGEQTVTISVLDNGIGMSREVLGKIFRPFSQADSTLERSRGGLGLGLVLSKQLIELHSGAIESHSDGVGKGSRFTVTLPAQFDIPNPAVTPMNVAASRIKRILVIEDNFDAADTLKMMLELLGYEVAVAGTGQEGIARLSDVRPHLVLCDIGLPGMDGYEVARAIRTTGDQCQLIALTGYGQEDDRRRAREAGFDVHLTKPVDPTVLEALLAKGS